jgi:hypothetical protein
LLSYTAEKSDWQNRERTKPRESNKIRGATMSRRAKGAHTKGHLIILLCTLLIATLLPHSIAFAAQVTLAWDAPAGEAVVDGYRVFSHLEG